MSTTLPALPTAVDQMITASDAQLQHCNTSYFVRRLVRPQHRGSLPLDPTCKNLEVPTQVDK